MRAYLKHVDELSSQEEFTMGCVGTFNPHKSGSVQENAPEFKERPGRTVNKCVCRDKSDPTFDLHPAGQSNK